MVSWSRNLSDNHVAARKSVRYDYLDFVYSYCFSFFNNNIIYFYLIWPEWNAFKLVSVKRGPNVFIRALVMFFNFVQWRIVELYFKKMFSFKTSCRVKLTCRQLLLYHSCCVVVPCFLNKGKHSCIYQHFLPVFSTLDSHLRRNISANSSISKHPFFSCNCAW